MFNKKQLTDFQNDFRAACRQHAVVLDGPLEIHVVCFFFKPKSNKNAYPVGRPDVDNFLKSILDSMNPVYLKLKDPVTGNPQRIISGWNGFWNDDSQVVDARIQKRWLVHGTDPFISVTVGQI